MLKHFGTAQFDGTNVPQPTRRWMRFANAVLMVASVERLSRLLAFARDVEPTRMEGTLAFEAFPTTVAGVTAQPTYTGRLPRVRAADTTPLPEGAREDLRAALVTATQKAYPDYPSLEDHIIEAAPDHDLLVNPAVRSSLKSGIVVPDPITQQPVARVYVVNTELREQVIAAIQKAVTNFNMDFI